MSDNVTIPLSKPIEGHPVEKGGAPEQITALQIRRPIYADVMRLGEPMSYARSEGGLIYTAERDGILEQYISRLLIEPKDPALLAQMNLEDTLRLRETISGFFTIAREAIFS